MDMFERKVIEWVVLGAPKKVKTGEPSKVIGDEEGAAPSIQDMIVLEIPECHLKRINKMIPVMEEMLHILASNMLEADAPESSDYVPKWPVTKAKGLETAITMLLDTVKGFAKTRKAYKSTIK